MVVNKIAIIYMNLNQNQEPKTYYD